MSFDSHTYFIHRPPVTHNLSPNIAISRKEGSFLGEHEKCGVLMSYSGAALCAAVWGQILEEGRSQPRPSARAQLAQEGEFAGTSCGFHRSCFAHYKEVEIEPLELCTAQPAQPQARKLSERKELSGLHFKWRTEASSSSSKPLFIFRFPRGGVSKN